MKLALVAALFLAGCGARSGLYAPSEDYVEPGALPTYCNGAVDESVFVVTTQSQIFRFDPTASSFTLVGDVSCPVTITGDAPFSMAVDHQGTAYMVFQQGELFLVDTRTGECSAPPAPLDSSAFTMNFGMGFTSDPGGATETLYLASTDTPGKLGTLDRSSFVISPIASFSKDIGEAELTGTGDGRLFAFGVDETVSSDLSEIETTDASVESERAVPAPDDPSGWAFSFWGGDFYFFTSVDGATSTVGRFHPADGSYDATYATLPNGAIVGAGVSTCAPR